MEKLRAKLEYIVFENKQNHYVVGSFSDLDTYHIFTASGNVLDVQEGMEYELEGEYITHPKYGNQFQIKGASKILPSSQKQIVRFLSSETFSGIGKKTAQAIYDLLGDSCLEDISKDISLLYQIPSLNQKKIDIIKKGLEEFQGFNEVYVQLLKMGLSDSKIALLESKYKDVMKTIEENCFQPYYEISGFGYKSAVMLANYTGMDPMDIRRQDAYIYNICKDMAMNTGNTYLTWANVVESANGLEPNLVIDTLHRLKENGYLYIEKNRVYPFSLYEDEKEIAELVQEHIFPVEQIENDIINSKIHEVEFAYNIEYDDKQKDAFYAFFQNSISILNGGPGTGKTTVVKGILKICKSMFPESTIQICAPTGRASKRLSQLSDCDSRTIHSLLQWDLESNIFKKNEEDPLECDFLIVDEFSMVDTHLFAALLKALPLHCRIFIIGDENQLESVGPGKVFEDIIDSNLVPAIHLEKIFRQKNGSGIVSLAKSIRDEKPCIFEDGVHFIELEGMDIVEQIRYLSIECDIDSMQILAPMYKGVAGIDAINGMMQQIHNPKSKNKKEIRIGSTIFREQDKVMLLKNMPDNDVYNGDIGKITRIEKTSEKTYIEVDFQSQFVEFSSDFLYYLSHAYCISVHKSQGSEYDTVFVIVDRQASYMLEKRLLYTAISRAKKELYILGNKSLFERQVKLKQKRIRQTSLKEFLLNQNNYESN